MGKIIYGIFLFLLKIFNKKEYEIQKNFDNEEKRMNETINAEYWRM